MRGARRLALLDLRDRTTHSFFLGRVSGGATMNEIDRLLDVIRGRNAKTVGLQFPVGLRTTAVDLAREIETKAGVMCLVSADPSFGACDVAEMPVDLIVHLGHAPMPHLRYNRVFFYDLPGAPLASMAFVDAVAPPPVQPRLFLRPPRRSAGIAGFRRRGGADAPEARRPPDDDAVPPLASRDQAAPREERSCRPDRRTGPAGRLCWPTPRL